MTELSNAVTVLIARMESHPEDFNTTGLGNPKFRDVADALYGLAGLDKERAGSYWFLSDADKQALIEAWKKYHRAEMEKEIMSAIFDDGAEEREAELERQRQRAHINAQMARIGAAQQIQPGQLQPLPLSAQNTGGLIGSSYPYMANSAQNAVGIVEQQGSRGFLSGIFK
jgi:hypothetical protein